MTEMTLKQLMQNTRWTSLLKIRNANPTTIGDDEVLVGYYVIKNKSGSTSAEVRIRMGQNVSKKLRISVADKMQVFCHPDDMFGFMMMKDHMGNGYKLTRENSSRNILRFGFRWKNIIIPNRTSIIKTDYLYNPENQSIVFRRPDHENDQ